MTPGFGSTVGQQLIDGGGDLTDSSALPSTRRPPKGWARKRICSARHVHRQYAGDDRGRPSLNGNSVLNPTVTFSSDFLDFSTTTIRDFSLSLQSWISNGGNGLSIDTLDNYFNSATATATGTFDSDSMPGPTVPNPPR